MGIRRQAGEELRGCGHGRFEKVRNCEGRRTVGDGEVLDLLQHFGQNHVFVALPSQGTTFDTGPVEYTSKVIHRLSLPSCHGLELGIVRCHCQPRSNHRTEGIPVDVCLNSAEQVVVWVMINLDFDVDER